MIFAVETEERTLITFSSELEAINYCEGLDVEAAIWLFWNDRGEPLEPLFITPNKRGFFTLQNGMHSLIPASPDHHADLIEVVEEILNFDSPEPFNSADGVRKYLKNGLYSV